MVKKLEGAIPYRGKLWRVQILAKWQGKHNWRNKLCRIDDKSLIKRTLKQFQDTSCILFEYTRMYLHIHTACELCQMGHKAVVVFSLVFSSIYD